MGDKKEQKKAIELMEETIDKLQYRIDTLQNRLKDTSEAFMADNTDTVSDNELEVILKEIEVAKRQMEYVKGAKKDAEILLAKEELREERERIEKMIKTAIVIGAISENVSIANARGFSIEMNNVNPVLKQELIDDIFDNNEYIFFKKDTAQLESVLNNKEYAMMAKTNPHKLEQEWRKFMNEYRTMVDVVLHQTGREATDDFDANQILFKTALRESNWYEKALGYTERDDYKRAFAPGVATESDRAFMDKVLKRTEKLFNRTKRLENELLESSEVFPVVLGYTKKLLDEEKALFDEVSEFVETKRLRTLELIKQVGEAQGKGNVPEELQKEFESVQLVFAALIPFRDVFEKQYQKDRLQMKKNQLLRRMEGWDIFKQYNYNEVVNMGNSERYTREVIEKENRMKAAAENRSKIVQDATDWAVADVYTILEMLQYDKPYKKKDKEQIRLALARMAIYSIFMAEERKNSTKYRPVFMAVFKANDDHGGALEQMAENLAADKEFIKKTDSEFLNVKNTKVRLMNFISNDMEHQLAEKFSGIDYSVSHSAKARNME